MHLNIVTKISALAATLVLIAAGVVAVAIFTGSNAVCVRHELASLG